MQGNRKRHKDYLEIDIQKIKNFLPVATKQYEGKRHNRKHINSW